MFFEKNQALKEGMRGSERENERFLARIRYSFRRNRKGKTCFVPAEQKRKDMLRSTFVPADL